MGLVEREYYGEGHLLAGQLAPQKMWIKCKCGDTRKVFLKALRDGVKRCKPCYQAERKAAKQERLAKLNAARQAKTEQANYDPSVALVTSMILAMGRSKQASL